MSSRKPNQKSNWKTNQTSSRKANQKLNRKTNQKSNRKANQEYYGSPPEVLQKSFSEFISGAFQKSFV